MDAFVAFERLESKHRRSRHRTHHEVLGSPESVGTSEFFSRIPPDLRPDGLTLLTQSRLVVQA